jgi:hypothetical protein
LADTVTIPAQGTGTSTPVIATDDVAGVHYQYVKLADGTADSAAKIAGDATNGLDVDVTRVVDGADVTQGAKADAAATTDTGTFSLIALIKRLLTKWFAEDTAHTSGDPGLMVLGVRRDTASSMVDADNDYAPLQIDATGNLRVVSIVSGGSIKTDKTAFTEGTSTFTPMGGVVNDTLAGDVAEDNNAAARITPKRALHVNLRDATATEIGTTTTPLVQAGNVAHDGVDAGNPNKIGARAIAHGTNPTAVAAADRTDLYANRAGVLFTIGGHPNTTTVRLTYTTAQTDVAIVTVATGLKIVVTRVMVTVSNATTVNADVIIGFGTANTPTTTDVVASHPGIPPGGGFQTGDGSGILGVGADNADLRVTGGAPTSGRVDIVVSYFTCES